MQRKVPLIWLITTSKFPNTRTLVTFRSCTILRPITNTSYLAWLLVQSKSSLKVNNQRCHFDNWMIITTSADIMVLNLLKYVVQKLSCMWTISILMSSSLNLYRKGCCAKKSAKACPFTASRNILKNEFKRGHCPFSNSAFDYGSSEHITNNVGIGDDLSEHITNNVVASMPQSTRPSIIFPRSCS